MLVEMVLHWVRMSTEETIQHDGGHHQTMKQHDLLSKHLQFGKRIPQMREMLEMSVETKFIDFSAERVTMTPTS